MRPFPGRATFCLKVADLDVSSRFYEALGMDVIERVDGLRVVLRSGTFTLALMPFLDANVLNFRGADVFALHADVKAKLPDVEGSPQRYSAGQFKADAPGECWFTRDPDGNQILFDTNRNEAGEASRRPVPDPFWSPA